MSSREHRSAGGDRIGRRRRLSRATLGLLAAGIVLATGGCAAGATQTASGGSAEAAPGAVPADELTGRIAEVEAARLCAVTALTFANEADITTDLDTRLAAVGLTHAQWKDWHDALVTSPDLVTQLAEVSAAGCGDA